MRPSITYTLPAIIGVSYAFTHPGMLHTDDDFARMVTKVEANATPWITGWELLTSNDHSSETYTPNPQEIVYRGDDGTHGENYQILYNDVAAAYALALRWKISGDTKYADTAVEILNGWASTLTQITGTSDAALAAGIYGYQFANAAEIMRNYTGWAAEDQTTFADMMVDVFYAINTDFLTRHNDAEIDHYWANWDLCNMASILSIAILTDDQEKFDEAINYFESGAGNGQANNFIWELHDVDGKILGQGQEAGRDQGHATLDFSLVGVFMQMAYNQGVDLFEYDDNLILAGSEYCSKYNIGEDVPYTTYTNSDVTQDVISENGRGEIRPAWELLYAHYSSIKGLDASYTGQMRDLVNEQSGGAEGGGGNYGSTSGGYDQLGYGTLTFRLE
ncbi:hypothetical protein FQN54_009694 [Arachnomyces sp. PD_36]|nr:hypothetical protein FQN54_009694 [Arachnomyces sp. PD_36]